jgi:hypothetical protein
LGCNAGRDVEIRTATVAWVSLHKTLVHTPALHGYCTPIHARTHVETPSQILPVLSWFLHGSGIGRRGQAWPRRGRCTYSEAAAGGGRQTASTAAAAAAGAGAAGCPLQQDSTGGEQEQCECHTSLPWHTGTGSLGSGSADKWAYAGPTCHGAASRGYGRPRPRLRAPGIFTRPKDPSSSGAVFSL